MKLFSFFRKRKEVIDIKVPEGPVNKSLQKAKDEEIYFERVKFESKKYSLKDLKTVKEKQDLIVNANLSIEKKVNILYHTYSFLRLFSRSALKDNKFNQKTIIIDREINRLKKMHEDLKRKTDIVKYVELNDIDLEAIVASLNDLSDFYNAIEQDLDNFKNQYYKHLRMTAYSICNDKSYQELDSINRNINKIIDEYKNINDAYDYIYYNSGSLIVDTINAFMECIENSNNQELKRNYKYSYFLNSDFVVALSFTEWIELFTKIKYVMRVASKVELFDYLKFKELYSELEKRYILMLIYNEMQK